MPKSYISVEQKDLRRRHLISEIKRVSKELGISHIPLKSFLVKSDVTSSEITFLFGTWNRALKSAGLEIYKPHPPGIPDEELMAEIIRVTKELKKKPSEGEMRAFGRYSPTPYSRRWGSFSKGREEAYKKLGCPIELKHEKRKKKKIMSLLEAFMENQ